MMIDLKQEVKESKDLRFLQAILGALLGQRCLQVEMSYGEELVLHFGSPLSYSHPKLRDETKGSWILGTRGSWWSLLLSDPPLLVEANGMDSGQPIESESLERTAKQLRGSNLVVVEPSLHPLRRPPHFGIALFLEFETRSRLVLRPNDELDGEAPLADWELFTPYQMYLACGPGPVWSYLRSDVVASPP